RAEVDITDIPISTIADQYMAYLSGIDRIDIDLAGEFLVMAATLMEIKSRMLVPPSVDAEGVDGESDAMAGTGSGRSLDPRADLVRQLLEYKRFRDAADAMESRRLEWARRFPARRAGIDDAALRAAVEAQADETDLEDLDLMDLVRAHARIVTTVNLDRLGDHTVVYDDTPIELHAEDIVDRLRRDDPGKNGVGLSAIFAGRTRPQMIGLFMAVLELVRNRRVAVSQDPGEPGAPGTIRISLRSDDVASTPGPTRHA
ncbi:MAG: segregation and condensation protein A, partial [Phycisphaerales bacterium]